MVISTSASPPLLLPPALLLLLAFLLPLALLLNPSLFLELLEPKRVGEKRLVRRLLLLLDRQQRVLADLVGRVAGGVGVLNGDIVGGLGDDLREMGSATALGGRASATRTRQKWVMTHCLLFIALEQLVDTSLPQQVVLQLLALDPTSTCGRSVHPVDLVDFLLTRLLLLESLELGNLAFLITLLHELLEFLVFLGLGEK
jgi:hypothetical protein